VAVGSCRVGSGRVRGARARPPRRRARERAEIGSRGRPPLEREVSGVILLHMVSHFN
jgi:hypothetical protein